MRIVLNAEESAGIQTLKLLHHSEHEVAAVMTSKEQANSISNVASLARQMDYAILDSRGVKNPDMANWIRDHDIDLLLNVHALYIIHPSLLEAPKIGSFNLHPGPLPEYSGLNAPSWAVFNQNAQHAVTLHWMTPRIDAGNIAYSKAFKLSSQDTGLSVSAKCVKLGLPLIQQLLKDASQGVEYIPRIKQDQNRRRFYYRDQVPWQGFIKWHEEASRIDAFVRACDYGPFDSPWGAASSVIDDNKINITKTKVTDIPSQSPPGTVSAKDEKGIYVATGDDYLIIERYKIPKEEPKASASISMGSQFSQPKELT